MSEATTDQITFVQYHKPDLEDGDYQVTVRQEVQVNGETHALGPATRQLTVAGPRFSLQPDDVQGVFPPAGSLGEHSNVLPHVAFTRATLPWERSPWTPGSAMAADTDDATPWLALLLFGEDERPEPKTVTLDQLKHPGADAGAFPAIELETGHTPEDQLTVIDVPWHVLEPILPGKDDLAFLAHVRDAVGPDEPAPAMLMGTRLPVCDSAGTASTVHLVSLERRYDDVGFAAQGVGPGDAVRLVSLKSWSFSCIDPDQSFKGLLEYADRSPSTLRLPDDVVNADAGGDDQTTALEYLRMGYVPLKHHLRDAGQTVSWYHGPLAASPRALADSLLDLLPTPASDALLRYNPDLGLFDVSYAAAWEIGRLLALRNKQFSVSLYNWKRAYARQCRQSGQADCSHLPLTSGSTSASTDLPETVVAWLNRLGLLHGVPFNYLVPDERMLPQESVRFFQVDPNWIACLLDGAFSIGRITSADQTYDADFKEALMDRLQGEASGLLLRCDVVAGWPGLLVDGYASFGTDAPLELFRMDRLCDNVLLCLFEGDLRQVKVHQKPETLHFGLDRPDDGSNDFYKALRDQKGIEWFDANDEPILVIPHSDMPLDDTSRVLRIGGDNGMAKTIQDAILIAAADHSELEITDFETFTSADLALEMTEGVEAVIYQRQLQGSEQS